MRELVAVITNSAEVPSEDDLEQVAKGVRSQRMNYCEDTGSVNTLSVALDPPLTAYSIGLPLHVRIRNTNTGPSTIDAGAGRVPIRKPNGSEMASGDLPAFGMAGLIYDGTVFQMINFGGAGGGPGSVFQINIPYCVDIGTVNQVIANFSPAVGSYTAGLIVMVKIANTNNTFANININGLGNKPIYAQGGHPNWPLLPGDLMVGDTIVFIYDGTAFWIYPNAVINQGVTFTVSTVAQFDQLFVALGRKRISTSGAVDIKLAPGTYGPALGALGNAVLTTYHPDSDRITLEGPLNAGQTPPRTGNFQRSGNSASVRANDANVNVGMLRTIYAAEIKINTAGTSGVLHAGPGQIFYKNLFVTGPNGAKQWPTNGFAAIHSRIVMQGCVAWGIGDYGFACVGNSSMVCYDCHANYCWTAGWGAADASSIGLVGGGSYSHSNHGMSTLSGSSILTNATDFPLSPTIANGFTSSHNAQFGGLADSSGIMFQYGTANSNGSQDLFAWNAGIVKQIYSSIGSTSPAIGAVGNLNSISYKYD